MQKIIKISTPWGHDFLKRTPAGNGCFGKYKFEIDNKCNECDYWIVWGGVKEKQRVNCPVDNQIYLTDETYAERVFCSEFLAQFKTVIACREDLQHPNVLRTHDLGIWHFNKSYDEIVGLPVPEKTHNLSVVCSDLTLLPGHKKRFAFVNQLIGFYRNRLDAFGRGIREIEDKFDALAKYKYSIAIENSFLNGYFTEKLFECFLTTTMPIYYGCPDLQNYFDDRSFIRIDINDFDSACDTVETIVKEDLFRQRLKYIQEAKRLYLERYFVFPALIRLIEGNEFLRERKRPGVITIRPEIYFQSSKLGRLKSRCFPRA